MVVIDIPSRKVVDRVDFGHGVRPHCPVYDRANGLLYVTTELDQTVTIIDPKTLKIVGTVPTGQKESHMLVISRDGKRGYTSNVGAGSVSVLDMAGHKTIAIIPISAESQRIAISNDDKMVFTSDQTKPQMAVIDTATNKIKTWVPLPAVGYGTSPTPDGRFLLIALPKANQLAVLDLATLKVVRTVDVAEDPVKVLASPEGKVAYVSCSKAKQIAVVNLSEWKVDSLIDAGAGVDGLAWAGAAPLAGLHNQHRVAPGQHTGE
jgi:YVTN family beta-propeller protein